MITSSWVWYLAALTRRRSVPFKRSAVPTPVGSRLGIAPTQLQRSCSLFIRKALQYASRYELLTPESQTGLSVTNSSRPGPAGKAQLNFGNQGFKTVNPGRARVLRDRCSLPGTSRSGSPIPSRIKIQWQWHHCRVTWMGMLFRPSPICSADLKFIECNTLLP
jgi:hypothetical protein